MGYAIHASPFFKLESKAKLAELLEAPLEFLLEVAANPSCHYKIFDKQVKTKTRHIEHPKKTLRKVQRRITELLQRISPPDYLHSAWKGRSYVTNARMHDCSQRMVKIDIKNFFPMTKAEMVFGFFNRKLLCSPDVSRLLTQLTTLNGHVPTGGMTSTIIAFFAYYEMFEEVYQLASKKALVMTCVVDDMAFSGAKASREFINSVAMIIRGYRLESHKRKYFQPGRPRIVTGVAVTRNGIRLPNVRRLKLHESAQLLFKETNPYLRRKYAKQLQGRAVEASQIEVGFDGLALHAASEAKAANSICAD